jgi:hypothetical protein
MEYLTLHVSCQQAIKHNPKCGDGEDDDNDKDRSVSSSFQIS